MIVSAAAAARGGLLLLPQMLLGFCEPLSSWLQAPPSWWAATKHM
jgi:hypothetical protein